MPDMTLAEAAIVVMCASSGGQKSSPEMLKKATEVIGDSIADLRARFSPQDGE